MNINQRIRRFGVRCKIAAGPPQRTRCGRTVDIEQDQKRLATIPLRTIRYGDPIPLGTDQRGSGFARILTCRLTTIRRNRRHRATKFNTPKVIGVALPATSAMSQFGQLRWTAGPANMARCRLAMQRDHHPVFGGCECSQVTSRLSVSISKQPYCGQRRIRIRQQPRDAQDCWPAHSQPIKSRFIWPTA